MTSSVIEVIPIAEVINDADRFAPVGSPLDRMNRILGRDVSSLRFNKIIQAQPTVLETKEFDKRMLQQIEDEVTTDIERPDYDFSNKPQIASYISEEKILGRINSVMPKNIPDENEIPSENYPVLKFIDESDLSPTAESLHERTEYMRNKAMGIIGNACINGMKIPEFNMNNGKKLPRFSIPILKLAVDFLGLNSKMDSPSQI